MNEQQWLASTDPTEMLEFLRARGIASCRKLRLFSCTCARRVAHLLLSPQHCRDAIEVMERFADGQASEAEVEVAKEAARLARLSVWGKRDSVADATQAASWATSLVSEDFAPEASMLASAAMHAAVHAAKAASVGYAAERRAQAALLRDILGPLPFRRVAVDESLLRWNNSTIPRLAQAAYDEKGPDGALDNSRLAVLADALEEADFVEPDVIGHCRQQGSHVRGC